MFYLKHLVLVFCLSAHGSRIAIRGMPEFTSLLELELLSRHIFGDSLEIGVNERVWVSLTALASIATVLEACSLEHLPDGWVTPVVWPALRPDPEVEVIMSTLKNRGHGPPSIPVQAHHVLLQLFERIVKGHFIVSCLALAKADNAFTIADENKDTSLVYSIESSDIGHTVRVHEDQCELFRIVNFVPLVLKVALWANSLEFVLVLVRYLSSLCVILRRILLCYKLFAGLDVHFGIFTPAELL